jgi:dUTP pyrophosphatase
MKIKITKIDSSIQTPKYATKGSSAVDLHSSEEMIISAGQRGLVHTGIKLEIPIGYEAQIRSRSGIASKKGVFVMNAPGTIDADYRGEIGVILLNSSCEDFQIKKGDRIAQMVFAPVSIVDFEEVAEESLSTTSRGSGGFGHTGV